MKKLLKILLSLPIISTIGSTISCQGLSESIIGSSTGNAFVSDGSAKFKQICNELESLVLDGSSLTTQNTLSDVVEIIQRYAGNNANVSILSLPNEKLMVGMNSVNINIVDATDLTVSKNIQVRIDGVKLYYQPQPLPVVIPTPDPTPTPTLDPTPTPTPKLDIDALVKAAYPYLESSQWWHDDAQIPNIETEIQNKLGTSVIVTVLSKSIEYTNDKLAFLKVSVADAQDRNNFAEYNFHGQLQLEQIVDAVGVGGTPACSQVLNVRLGYTTYGQILEILRNNVYQNVIAYVDVLFGRTTNLNDVVKKASNGKDTEKLFIGVVDKSDRKNEYYGNITFKNCSS